MTSTEGNYNIVNNKCTKETGFVDAVGNLDQDADDLAILEGKATDGSLTSRAERAHAWRGCS